MSSLSWFAFFICFVKEGEPSRLANERKTPKRLSWFDWIVEWHFPNSRNLIWGIYKNTFELVSTIDFERSQFFTLYIPILFLYSAFKYMYPNMVIVKLNIDMKLHHQIQSRLYFIQHKHTFNYIYISKFIFFCKT